MEAPRFRKIFEQIKNTRFAVRHEHSHNPEGEEVDVAINIRGIAMLFATALGISPSAQQAYFNLTAGSGELVALSDMATCDTSDRPPSGVSVCAMRKNGVNSVNLLIPSKIPNDIEGKTWQLRTLGEQQRLMQALDRVGLPINSTVIDYDGGAKAWHVRIAIPDNHASVLAERVKAYAQSPTKIDEKIQDRIEVNGRMHYQLSPEKQAWVKISAHLPNTNKQTPPLPEKKSRKTG